MKKYQFLYSATLNELKHEMVENKKKFPVFSSQQYSESNMLGTCTT